MAQHRRYVAEHVVCFFFLIRWWGAPKIRSVPNDGWWRERCLFESEIDRWWCTQTRWRERDGRRESRVGKRDLACAGRRSRIRKREVWEIRVQGGVLD